MSIRPIRIAAYASLVALTGSSVLWLVSLGRQSPGGTGENMQWMLSYLLLAGFPTTLAVAPLHALAGPGLIRVAMVLAVVVNWAIVAYLAALILKAAKPA